MYECTEPKIYVFMLDHLVDLIRDLNSIKKITSLSNKSQQILISFDDCSGNIYMWNVYVWMVNQTEWEIGRKALEKCLLSGLSKFA